MTTTPDAKPLPTWRLAAGILILAAMLTILLLFAPTYVADYRLSRYLRVAVNEQVSDLDFEQGLCAEAARLGLPVTPENLRISSTGSGRSVELRYVVHSQVFAADLHFHSTASTR